ncbi:hypothetical protein R1flu_011207 [Riccia fluitans]|uniref:Uncharacterized protein n=1 Tax=Riccia fluitans TaxID=41844 RepID=A0ABD1Z762_9MARC
MGGSSSFTGSQNFGTNAVSGYNPSGRGARYMSARVTPQHECWYLHQLAPGGRDGACMITTPEGSRETTWSNGAMLSYLTGLPRCTYGPREPTRTPIVRGRFLSANPNEWADCTWGRDPRPNRTRVAPREVASACTCLDFHSALAADQREVDGWTRLPTLRALSDSTQASARATTRARRYQRSEPKEEKHKNDSANWFTSQGNG